MVMRLVDANLKNDMDALDEVARLLNDLKGAWDSIRQSAAAAPQHLDIQPKIANRAQLAYARG
jgi:flagellar protein FliS